MSYVPLSPASPEAQARGSRLRKERTRLGLNQAQLGVIGGVRTQAQFRYESGLRNPDADYLAGVASIGIDVGYVVTGDRGANTNDARLQSFCARLADISGQIEALLADYPDVLQLGRGQPKTRRSRVTK